MTTKTIATVLKPDLRGFQPYYFCNVEDRYYVAEKTDLILVSRNGSRYNAGVVTEYGECANLVGVNSNKSFVDLTNNLRTFGFVNIHQGW